MNRGVRGRQRRSGCGSALVVGQLGRPVSGHGLDRLWASLGTREPGHDVYENAQIVGTSFSDEAGCSALRSYSEESRFSMGSSLRNRWLPLSMT